MTRASRQAETLSLSASDAAWHWLAVQRYCSPQLQPAAAAEPPADHDEWALGTGPHGPGCAAVGTQAGQWVLDPVDRDTCHRGSGHWPGTQDRRATAVKVLTQSPHETGTSPSLQSLQDSDENSESEARGRSPALSGAQWHKQDSLARH